MTPTKLAGVLRLYSVSWLVVVVNSVGELPIASVFFQSGRLLGGAWRSVERATAESDWLQFPKLGNACFNPAMRLTNES